MPIAPPAPRRGLAVPAAIAVTAVAAAVLLVFAGTHQGIGQPKVPSIRGVFGHPYRLLSPYPGLPAPVVATAWGKQLQLPSASDPRLTRFLDAYAGGPQAPERGANCSGGSGA
jgi:hypothetical protein